MRRLPLLLLLKLLQESRSSFNSSQRQLQKVGAHLAHANTGLRTCMRPSIVSWPIVKALLLFAYLSEEESKVDVTRVNVGKGCLYAVTHTASFVIQF